MNLHSRAHNFLSERKIFELFNFLISHLLVDTPDDPIDYLYDLLNKCILFKSGLCEPPLLFTKRYGIQFQSSAEASYTRADLFSFSFWIFRILIYNISIFAPMHSFSPFHSIIDQKKFDIYVLPTKIYKNGNVETPICSGNRYNAPADC